MGNQFGTYHGVNPPYIPKGGTSAWGSITGTIGSQTDLQSALTLKADKTNVLELNNTTAFTPTANYHPATKLYVDSASSGGGGGTVQDATTLAIQPTDEGVTTGNARGASAVDLQTKKSTPTQIASGTYSVISGGDRNTASGSKSTVSGGQVNISSGDYSTVSGGGSNNATGGSSTVGGGVSNNASYDYAVVSGGISNNATGGSSTVGGGGSNNATGLYSVNGGGQNNISSGNYSTVGGGGNNNATGLYSVNGGGRYNYTYLLGQSIHGGYNASYGNARQSSYLTMQKTTTDGTIAECFLDNSSARAVLQTDSTWGFEIKVLATNSANNSQNAYFRRFGLIYNDGGTVALESSIFADGGDIVNSALTGIIPTISADDTNNSLKVQVTGLAGINIIWQIKIALVEIEV